MFEINNITKEDIKEISIIQDLLNKVIVKEEIEDTIFNIILVDNTYIHKLNREYRGIDRPTDVISFALEDDETMPSDVRILGDIYISIDKVKEQSEEYGHSFLRELAFLSVHGLLHLLGYDHMNPKDEKVMFDKQEAILNEAGITK